MQSDVALPCRTGFSAVLQDKKFPVPLRESDLSPSVAASCRFSGRHGSSNLSELDLRERERETKPVCQVSK